MADAPDLGSGALGRGGSSPLIRTRNNVVFCQKQDTTFNFLFAFFGEKCYIYK